MTYTQRTLMRFKDCCQPLALGGMRPTWYCSKDLYYLRMIQVPPASISGSNEALFYQQRQVMTLGPLAVRPRMSTLLGYLSPFLNRWQHRSPFAYNRFSSFRLRLSILSFLSPRKSKSTVTSQSKLL